MADDRYERIPVTLVSGRTGWIDRYTRAALDAVEADLGYELGIVQASYHGGVSQSAGTHDGGGALDLLAWDHENKVRALRKAGFAAWYRPKLPGYWNPHIHAIQIGNAKASPAAKRQVEDYFDHRNGLANNAWDNQWRPDNIHAFDYGQQEWDEMASKQDIAEVVRDMVLKYAPRVEIDAPPNATDIATNPTWSLDNHIETQTYSGMLLLDRLHSVATDVAETKALVDALLSDTTISAEDLASIRESAREGAEDAIEATIDSATVVLSARREETK